MGATDLPVELWSRVFTFTLGDDNNRTALQAIMSVNRKFHSIANSTPQLWTRIIFTEDDHFTDLPRARRLLRRSGSLPLHVEIDLPDSLQQDGVSLADLLRAEVHRFLTIQLSSYTQHVLHQFLFQMGRDQPAPLLQRLCITCEDDESDDWANLDEYSTLRSLFEPSPRLSHVRIPAFLLRVEFPLSLLSTVHDLSLDADGFEDDFHLERVLNVLPHMPLLRTFEYACGHNITQHFHAFPIVSTPQLLTATVDAPGQGLAILCRLDAPNLQSIHLNGFDVDLLEEESPDPLPVALSYLSQTMSSLTSLELKMVVIREPTTIFPWLLSAAAFPALKVLAVRGGTITDEALQLCTPCTKIRRLELCVCDNVTLDGLLRFVEGCDKSFELLVHECPLVPADKGTSLSQFVKVEFDHTVTPC